MEKIKYIRPEGYEDEKRDCTVRALSLVSNLPYEEVHTAFKEAGRRSKFGVYAKKVIQKVCKELNLEAKQVKRSGTVNKLIKLYPQGKLFCLKRGHAFALIDGVIHDEKSLNSHIKGAWIIQKRVNTSCINEAKE